MKTSFFALLATFLMLTSCSRSEDIINEETTETPFFNLKVGNEWVYKTYDRPDFTSNLKPTGEIDSVKIVSTVALNGKNYFKVENINRKAPSNYPNRTVSYNYWRVNDKGHLVSLSSYYFDQGNTSDNLELVKHPGKDFAHQYTDISLNQFGTIIYKLYPNTTITLDNQAYLVSPYNGQFTPNAQNQNLLSKTVENNYKEGVGLVKTVCHSVAETYSFEQHLVGYSLK